MESCLGGFLFYKEFTVLYVQFFTVYKCDFPMALFFVADSLHSVNNELQKWNCRDIRYFMKDHVGCLSLTVWDPKAKYLS